MEIVPTVSQLDSVIILRPKLIFHYKFIINLQVIEMKTQSYLTLKINQIL